MACSTCGTVVIPDAALAALVRAHWGDKPLSEQETAFAIAIAESGCGRAAADAWNQCCTAYGCEDSRGAWQINVAPNANPEFASWALFDPDTCARAARIMYDRNYGFSPWTTYTGGAYLTYWSRAVAALSAPPVPQCPSGWSGVWPNCVPPPLVAPLPTLASTVVCSGGQTQIRYDFQIFGGVPTALIVSSDLYFSNRAGFFGPFTASGSVTFTPPAPGSWYGVLNRYAFLPETRVQDTVTSLVCGQPPVQSCPAGTTGTWPNCTPAVTQPVPAAGAELLPALALGLAVAGAVYVVRRRPGALLLHR